MDPPVVLSTPSQAVSFLPDEVTYIDSLNRVRAIHFASGELMQINMTLASIFDELPAGRFAYCHRSVVVNLAYVKSVTSTEVILSDGTALPMSRRRYQDFKAAAARLGISL